MKQIITFLTILLPISLFAQINETFSGPEITSENPWKGDIDEFWINPYQELEFISIPGDAGEMSIYLTEVPYHTNMMWELEVTLDFKPTNSNNCRIQVFSYTNLTLTEKFYIQIGNNNTQISLYRQDTGNPVLCIGGRRSLIESPYTKVYIRLLLLESKTWVLQTRTENEPVYTTEGTYNRTVPDYIKKGTFMITCRYIKSRISTFWFDNISIQSYEEGSPGDKDDIPELENIIIRSLSQIELAYTAPVNISTAVVTITGMGKAEKLAYGENNACVLCDFPFQLEKEETYELEIKGLKTIAGTNVPTEKWEIAVEEGNTPPPEPPPAEKIYRRYGSD
ncbi:MAG: hypothetical protein LUE98_00410 [Tannerellaceae bacterium]|nr:hypothetical protein [Tannerellaceae bacterium]